MALSSNGLKRAICSLGLQRDINSLLPAFKPAVCPPKAFLAPLTPQANAPRPHQQLFLGLQGAINSFLLAFKPAACQASNLLKASKGFLAPLTLHPRHQSHINSFFSAFKAPSIAFYWRSSLPFARLQTLQNLPETSQNP